MAARCSGRFSTASYSIINGTGASIPALRSSFASRTPQDALTRARSPSCDFKEALVYRNRNPRSFQTLPAAG